jgi:ribose-phosphate pyrophosphokinase
MQPIIFNFPKYQNLANAIASNLQYQQGKLETRHYPEGESYVRLLCDVKDREVILVCGLEEVNHNAMAIMFFSAVAKELGALRVGLIAPYLGYMRQDKRFNEGEAITSNIFAKFLSQQVDWLLTVDPHLHRHKTLEEIYSIPCLTLHATGLIADWIKNNIENPLLIGPDSESQQWVEEVAKFADVPFIILTKIRYGDENVKVSIPEVEKYKNHTPILIDDIIATASTMIETINHLKNAGMKDAVCIGVHAIFAGDAYQKLRATTSNKIITCNTIEHFSNGIDVSGLIVEALRKNYTISTLK